MMDARERDAFDRIVAKRRYLTHVASFGLLSGLLTVIWAQGAGGFFWPAILLAGWGLHLVVCGLGLYARPITMDQIAAEVERTGAGGVR